MADFTPRYTINDVEAAERELSELLEEHSNEPDEFIRDMMAAWIRIDTQALNDMREAVFPSLPFCLPIGLPAPTPYREYR